MAAKVRDDHCWMCGNGQEEGAELLSYRVKVGHVVALCVACYDLSPVLDQQWVDSHRVERV